MDRLKRQIHLPQTFCACDRKQQKFIQKTLTTDQLKFILDVLHNLNKKNINFPPSLMNELKKKKKVIKYLLQKSTPIKEKREKVINGHFLPFLFSILASTAANEILQRVINK